MSVIWKCIKNEVSSDKTGLGFTSLLPPPPSHHTPNTHARARPSSFPTSHFKAVSLTQFFVRRWFHNNYVAFVFHCLFPIFPSISASERLSFISVAFPGYIYLYVSVNPMQLHCFMKTTLFIKLYHAINISVSISVEDVILFPYKNTCAASSIIAQSD